uniref:Uncharacterized protein n=1 Tax=Phenylobacterium glaciei TaxID=2803784 RepID=A0A974P2C5_9CAUL|nr:hypothetical protein JKL49_25260 [Phenylobacterium glaciei]
MIAKQPQLTDMQPGLLMHASWEDLGAFDAALKDAGARGAWAWWCPIPIRRWASSLAPTWPP